MTQKIKILSLSIFVGFSFLCFLLPATSASAATQPIGNNLECKNNTGLCDKNPIVRNLNNIINVLSGLVGIVIVGSIILGGVQFAAAGDKAEAVSAAKQRITNGLIALLAYLFIFTFLQWLIPGGVFG